jgi:hypothetical protein
MHDMPAALCMTCQQHYAHEGVLIAAGTSGAPAVASVVAATVKALTRFITAHYGAIHLCMISTNSNYEGVILNVQGEAGSLC